MRPLDAKSEGKIPILKKNGDLSNLVELTVKDIFKRLDKIQINNSLDYKEFAHLLEKGVGDTVSQDEFEFNILPKYCHNN